MTACMNNAGCEVGLSTANSKLLDIATPKAAIVKKDALEKMLVVIQW